MQCWVDGIGLIGPGLDSWEQAHPLLTSIGTAKAERARLPAPLALPAAERRRSGPSVKAVLAAGAQALQAGGGVAAADLATVFTSSGGDGVNCHEICQALASADRVISPTRFHNSVHNAPAGYWSISSGSMATASVLCAFDGSFAAGLLEAMAQVVAERRAVLLVAYDTDYPQPLQAVRPIPDTMAVAMLLSPAAGPHSLGRLSLQQQTPFTQEPATTMPDGVLEAVRASIPAGRSLPLLRALALGGTHGVALDYLDGLQLAVRCDPC